MTDIDITWNTLLAAVKASAHDAGVNAANWWEQDNVGGYVNASTGIARATAVLKGIDDGDPEILDSLPSADLSGQWADSDTADSVYADVATDDAADWSDLEDWQRDEVADTWELAYNESVMTAVYAYCHGAIPIVAT
jgi:hypothetical protein